jgi:aminoglycoside 6-adenylyltransferase
VCPYAAKGLWRGEPPYAKAMIEQAVRPELTRMLAWYVGVHGGFTANPGKLGKYLHKKLPPELWAMLEQTYAGPDPDQTWQALFVMCALFRRAAERVALHFGYPCPDDDDRRVSAHLRHVRALPRDAREMY